MAKKAAKKAKVKKGIFFKKSSKGISAHLHSANGNKLAVLTGYNKTASAQKGLAALHKALAEAYNDVTGKYNVTDETKKA